MNLKTILFLILFVVITPNLFSQAKEKPSELHHKNELAIGVDAGFGYNVLNHVDGTLAVIPNNTDPTPTPGSPVYASAMSINIDAPLFTMEYWIIPSVSFKSDLGLNMIVAGASHALSDFAYIYTYLKLNVGARYYLDSLNLSAMFIGTGVFGDFPLAAPLLGFISSESHAGINTGPYAELGVNYPVNDSLNLEAFVRFYFGTLALSKKSDPTFLADVYLSPLDISFGIEYRVF